MRASPSFDLAQSLSRGTTRGSFETRQTYIYFREGGREVFDWSGVLFGLRRSI